MVRELSVETRGQGLYEVAAAVQGAVADAKLPEGLCTIFVRHTSASLLIQENADPSAKHDLERDVARHLPVGTSTPRLAARADIAHRQLSL